MAAKPATYTRVEGKIIRETDAAILFKIAGTSHWFPLSQVSEIHRDVGDAGEIDVISVADWILNKKGIEL